MVVPCIVKSALYVSALTTVAPGRASCRRMMSASIPPRRKNANALVP